MTALIKRWRWRVVAAPVAVLLVAATLFVTFAGKSAAAYRTAVATTGDVTQTLSTTGSIESASRSDVGFQVDGTVKTVPVSVGDTVKAGDVLATLDTEDLQTAVDDAQKALDEAEQKLADDLEAQRTGSSTSSASPVSSTSDAQVAPSSVTQASSTRAATTATAAVVSAAVSTSQVAVRQATVAVAAADSDTLDKARQRLLAAQEALLDQYDAAQARVEQADDAQTKAKGVCVAFTDASSSAADAEDGETDGGDSGTDSADTAAALAECQSATQTALEASRDSIAAQKELMERASEVDDAVAAYRDALDDAAGDTDVTPTPDASATPEPDASATPEPEVSATPEPEVSATPEPEASATPEPESSESPEPDSGVDLGVGGEGAGLPSGQGDLDTGSLLTPESGSIFGGDSSASLGSGGGGQVPSAEDILADKASITAAEAELAVAQQQLENATITAPVAGKVVAVGLTAGESASAGDTEAVVTVVADNAYLVRLSVSLREAKLLAPGQDAQVTLASSGQVVKGTVSRVSNLNSGNAYSQSYAVTVAIPDPGFAIRIGAATRMDITVAAATNVLVVPTSAVANASADATVQVVGADGTAESREVTTGAVGATYTEITSGLDKGDQVILADLNEEISTDDETESSDGLLGGLDGGDGSDMQFDMPDGFQPPGGRPGGVGGIEIPMNG